MSLRLLLGSAVTLGLVACGGTANQTSITGNDPDSLKSSQAGVATLVFLDIEGGLRPDNITNASSTSGACPQVTGPTIDPTTHVSTSTFTYGGNGTTCAAANGNSLTGTVTMTFNPTLLPPAYSLTYNLTSTNSAQPTRYWTYIGTRSIALNAAGTGAHVTVDPGFIVAYTDSANTKNNQSYTYDASLDYSWGNGSVTLSGAYSFTQGSMAVLVSMPSGLTWSSGCCYPTGTLNLSSSVSSAEINAVFGPTCGNLTLNGGQLSLATCN